MLNVNQPLLNRLTAIKQRRLNEMSKKEFHFFRLDEINFLKSKIHISKQLKQIHQWEQYSRT